MSLDRLIDDAPPDWREPFRKFIETGEADERFVEWMDHDSACQRAVEKAFELQASTIKMALLDLGGPGPETPQELEGGHRDDLRSRESTVVPHPAMIRARPAWRPYALAAGVVLAITGGIGLTGMTAIHRDQVLRLAELGERQAKSVERARHLADERNFFQAQVASLEQTVEEHRSEREAFERRLNRQQTRLASLEAQNGALQEKLHNRSIVTVAADLVSSQPPSESQTGADLRPETSWSSDPAPPFEVAFAGPRASVGDSLQVMKMPPQTSETMLSDVWEPFTLPSPQGRAATTQTQDLSTPTLVAAQEPTSSPAPLVARFTPPRLLSERTSRHNAAARRLGLQGEVVIECVVTEAGQTEDCKVLKSIPQLDRFALRFARNAEFEPGRNADGEPQRMTYRLRVPFGPDAYGETPRKGDQLNPIHTSTTTDRQ